MGGGVEHQAWMIMGKVEKVARSAVGVGLCVGS